MPMEKPSRREQRDAKFLYLAERGKVSCNTFSLYKSEEKTLREKEGFDVERRGENIKKELPATISWGDAFKSGVPLVVRDYIYGRVDTFPKWKMKTWAQELYVIAARANYEMAQTNFEIGTKPDNE